ncbi:MAG: DoxX family protein [bacterium]
MKNLTTIGRFLFALPFGILGLNHFFMYNYYVGIVSSFIPGGGFTVIIVGLALIAAAISIIAKKFIVISCLLLALLLLVFICTIHIPGLFSASPEIMTISVIELFKDTALMGGALMIAGIYKEEK